MINRNLFILSVGQIFSFTSPVVSVLLSGIIGSAMTEINYLATLPTALMIVGTAFGSLIASKIMKIKGRKFGFSLAAIINSLFSLFCAYAILINSFTLFLSYNKNCTNSGIAVLKLQKFYPCVKIILKTESLLSFLSLH